MSNNKKSTYEKLFGKDDIFSDSVLDEMQKRESYGIAFKLFRAMYLIFLFGGMAMYCVGVGLENIPLCIAGLAVFAAAALFEVLYAGFTSARGIMPENFMNKNTGKAWIKWTVYLIMYFLLFVLVLDTDSFNWFIIPLWIVACVYRILICCFSERNKKVREKMLDE